MLVPPTGRGRNNNRVLLLISCLIKFEWPSSSFWADWFVDQLRGWGRGGRPYDSFNVAMSWYDIMITCHCCCTRSEVLILKHFKNNKTSKNAQEHQLFWFTRLHLCFISWREMSSPAGQDRSVTVVPTVVQAVRPLLLAQRANARLQPSCQMLLFSLHVLGEDEESIHLCRDISPGCLHCPTAEREDDITADQRRLRILHAPPNTAPDQRGGSPRRGDVNNGATEGSSGAATWMWRQQRCHVSPPRVNGIMSHLL